MTNPFVSELPVPVAGLCAVIVLVLPALTSGYVIQAAVDPSTPQELNVRTNAETAWMVTGIIFIVLFAVAVIVCIYLWFLRNAKVKELRQLELAHGRKDNRNVWYGGDGGGNM